MSLLDKLKKNSTIKSTQILSDSDFFASRDMITTRVPALNIALSGSWKGGFLPGLTIFAAESKHFKSNFSLIMVAAYLQKYPDAICLFYDSEFGVTPDYLLSMGVDSSRLIHTPITNVEELKFDVVNQLENINRGDRVIIMIDSIGNLASKKELEDAKDQKSVADMSRAKSLKSLFRIVTPYLSSKDIPMVVVNHVYSEQGMFPKTIMGGGQGIMLAANTVFFISKAQDKDGKELLGYNFTLIAEKSRFIREKSRIPVSVKFDSGIEKWSGLFELARDIGWIEMPSSGWYTAKNPHTGEVFVERARAKEIEDNDEFWEKLFAAGFDEDIKQKYCLTSAEQVKQDEDE